MATAPVTSTPPQSPQGSITPTSGASKPSQSESASSASTVAGPSATKTTKPDNDKVSLSDAAAKLLAANKKVNPDGTVGPHHKPRHPHSTTKPI